MSLDLEGVTAESTRRAATDAGLVSPIDAPGGDELRNLTLETLLAEAARREASHVHVEPVGRGAVVRLRIGGGLAVLGRLTADRLRAISAEIDARAGADARFCEGGATIGVSRLATRDGARIVLQLAVQERTQAALEELGMRPQLLAALRPALNRGGLVLLAGASGSGTTTTLRALLRHLAEGNRTLVAIEPLPGPRIDGVAQAAIGGALRAADALRQARLQDCDGIGIDGIADRETAALAVEAAQDGMLVVATVAAPDAVGAIRRMREWRVGPFALASTLNLVLAQRLVRRLCPQCRIPVQADGSVSALLGFDPGAIVYSAGGCGACDGTGHAGEIAVFEAIDVDPALRRLLNDSGDEAILSRHAFVSAPNLGSAARALVRAGVTTPEEAVRVSRG